ncbi:diguanylate cyclase/phosphodiesterase [Burkholderia sp. lig30]|uniref:GGDEF domain-containing protein n=1 Tax=Burkholderia sp. lig30 TaxID=1192124 RepID=UPI000460AE7C|nr:GGDEF domain-containing protein [Burkholderia sp. lig30]KDB08394.1 diguanylate cyclase/phosphodiesterase [Burkholderia sp. lig30]
MTASIAECIERQLLRPAFQPIGALTSGNVIAFEALIRGPAGTSLESAAALFERAQLESAALELERGAAQIALTAFGQARLPGKLFVNFSADAIRELAERRDELLAHLSTLQLSSDRIVIELTEQAAIGDLSTLAAAVSHLRASGMQLALDNYGSGNANLTSWKGLRPDYIKIARAIVDGAGKSPVRIEVLRALRQIAEAAHTQLIAEGIENAEDLMACRDLRIAYGQGFFLGRPKWEPVEHLEEAARSVIRDRAITVFPDATSQTTRAFSVGKLVTIAPTLSPDATNNHAFDLLTQCPDLHAVAIVEGGKPVGLLNRRAFQNAYARPFHREIYGRKSCMAYANLSPVMVEKSATTDDLAELLTNDDQRYLAEGVIVVEDGQYVGVATGESLVRAVTEVRIEAARYANPLTSLPGNIPIDMHIKRLVERGAPFRACYCDLNNFKPFNDQYGYWKGDEMLKLAASILKEACDPRRDFLGHIGGDDFLIFYQSEDWESRLRTAMQRFNEGVRQLYTPADIKAGGIHAEDRHGDLRFYPFVTLAVGVVPVSAGLDVDGDAIASLAAIAKREAKKSDDSFHVADCPRSAACCEVPSTCCS